MTQYSCVLNDTKTTELSYCSSKHKKATKFLGDILHHGILLVKTHHGNSVPRKWFSDPVVMSVAYRLLLSSYYDPDLSQPLRNHDVISLHDDFIKWKHFPCYWPFVQVIHWSPVNSPHKGQWRGALVFSFIGAWTNGWVNTREAGDLRQ